ncbi:MAG TPA: wax ester/triacylglycerol synthase family O-acyltransferase [Dehalococcoidia bacterium]|nr:wax ester/triacylglycerol synthase family O-acyltransferase [Dehalococcoidia bacterium]
MKRKVPQRLSFQDAAFAYFERDAYPLNVGSVAIYEGTIGFPRFLAHVDRRIQLEPRYRQRLIGVPFALHHAQWVDDPDFDVRHHVSSVALPAPGSEQQLAAMAGEFFSTRLRRDQPLWEMRLVEGLSGGRTAHLAKVHHCLVDGVGGVGLLAALLDTSPEPRHVRLRAHEAPPLPGGLSLIGEALYDRAMGQLRFNERLALGMLDWRPLLASARSITRALWAAGPYFVVPAVRTPWAMRLHAPSRLAWQVLPFADAHRAARELGGTINDLALTVIAGGLRRYLEGQDVSTKGLVLRAGLPVSVRRDEHAALGNRVSFMLAGLPVGVRDARERFRIISSEVSSLKQQGQAAGVEELMERLGDLPPAVHMITGQTLAMPNRLTNLICTNVPGPLQPLYLQGHRMLQHFPWVPIAWQMGLSVAIMSYDTGLYFSITADRETPGDITAIAAGIGDAFDELMATTASREPRAASAPRPSGVPATAEPASRTLSPAPAVAAQSAPGG